MQVHAESLRSFSLLTSIIHDAALMHLYDSHAGGLPSAAAVAASEVMGACEPVCESLTAVLC